MNRSDKRRQAKAGKPAETLSPAALDLLRQGLALQRQGRLDEAASRYRDVLRTAPTSPQTNHLLGLVEHQRGQSDAAVALLNRAIATDASNAVYRTDLGMVLRAMRRPADATASLTAADRLRPNDPRTLAALAGAYLDTGKITEAAGCFRRAVAAAPGDAGLHGSLGNVLNMLGQTDAAYASFRKALEIAPSAAVHSNFGHALAGNGALDEAVGHYRQALQLDPDALAPRLNLGLALSRQGKPVEAQEAFREALARHPKAVEAIAGYAGALERSGHLAEALAQYELVLRQQPNDIRALRSRLFLHNYLGDRDPAAMTAEARHFGQVLAAAAGPGAPHDNDPAPDRQLRIGFVSGDLRRHPVGRFLTAPLAEIDPAKVELFAYATQVEDDELTAELQRGVPNWRRVAHLDARQLAETIRADRIDILVDLSGLTGDGRLPTFALKPAPIAVTWLGYFATTGLNAIDYVLCNETLVPPKEEGQWIERPWRMPRSYFCFSVPPREAPLAAPPCLTNGVITFGSFNNLNKLNDRTAALWAEVLRQIPGSRLLLRSAALENAETAQRTRARFGALGIEPGRLLLEGHLSNYMAHLATYNRVDIALDSFPYAGGTTTIEALWMGVPVLTLKGDRFVAHMGENILQQAGLPEWIATDRVDFVRKAVDAAADHAPLATLRRELRPRLAASPLFDAPRFARDLEDAFRQMWQRWSKDEVKRQGRG